MPLKSEFESTGNWLFKYRSYLPLLILPLLFYTLLTPVGSDTQNILLIVGLTIAYFGECIRIYTIAYAPVGTSGRNTKQQFATTLNTEGIYSMVRHPLYLGNFLIYLGPFIFTGNIYSIIIFILIFWIYYERIMYAEEAFLIVKFGNVFEEWSSKTPAFIPNIKLFTIQNSKFSLVKVLKSEYSGLCGVFAIFTIIVVFRNYSFNITPILSYNWKVLFIINTILYISLRTFKNISFYNKL